MARSNYMAGTPLYMAPEQHLGAPSEPRGDQFSFCVGLYLALYGQPPFAGNTLEHLAKTVTSGRLQPPPPRHPRTPARSA